MEMLRNALEREHEARVAAEEEAKMIRVLSPFERFMLVCYASVVRLAHVPKPRCLCCGGPLFWCLMVPWVAFRLSFGVSPLVLISEPRGGPGEDDTWWAEARRPAVDYARRRGPPESKMPVVMLPGMTSTGLEVWQGINCYAGAHRRRLWSSAGMLSRFILEPDCLQKHLALNLSTWDDPDRIKVRASTGLSGADAFGPLNLWGELMANFAILGYDQGYDESSLALLGFDWRLSPQRLEARDGYFTSLRRAVELLYEVNGGTKVAVLAHSLGANHCLHFFGWIEARKRGWVDTYVGSFVPIGGAFLGSAKAMAYLVSGEMTDAVGMGPVLKEVFESHGGIDQRGKRVMVSPFSREALL